MAKKIFSKKHAGTFSNHQQFFFRYTLLVLIDLTVLGLFNEYWSYVVIDSFTIALLAAILLQVSLKLTLAIEHRIADYFKPKSGLFPKIARGLSTWAVLFISKLLILEAINFAFGNHVLFTGPVHGLLSFIVVVIVILIIEQMFSKIFKALA